MSWCPRPNSPVVTSFVQVEKSNKEKLVQYFSSLLQPISNLMIWGDLDSSFLSLIKAWPSWAHREWWLINYMEILYSQLISSDAKLSFPSWKGWLWWVSEYNCTSVCLRLLFPFNSLRSYKWSCMWSVEITSGSLFTTQLKKRFSVHAAFCLELLNCLWDGPDTMPQPSSVNWGILFMVLVPCQWKQHSWVLELAASPWEGTTDDKVKTEYLICS